MPAGLCLQDLIFTRRPPKSARRSSTLRASTKADNIVATGYGRRSIPFAGKAISEITAQAEGVCFLYPEVRGIIDIGGQDSKVILVEGGRVADFQMNDKCAAGTGRFLEHTARALEVSVEDMGRLALASSRPASISSMCTVFAESEVISLRAQGVPKEDIAAGLVESIAKRVAAMAKPMGLKEHVALVGGVAKNPAIRAALERELGLQALRAARATDHCCAGCCADCRPLRYSSNLFLGNTVPFRPRASAAASPKCRPSRPWKLPAKASQKLSSGVVE